MSKSNIPDGSLSQLSPKQVENLKELGASEFTYLMKDEWIDHDCDLPHRLIKAIVEECILEEVDDVPNDISIIPYAIDVRDSRVALESHPLHRP